MAATQGLSLFDLENKTRQQPKIAHEQGAGSQCTKCGPKCSGFDLHFWRKICRNCRCGKENHLVADGEDPSNRVVRLLETPVFKTNDGPATGPSNRPSKLNFNTSSQGAVLMLDGAPSSPLDWVPPSAEPQLAVKYIEQLPAAQQPITGSQAAVDRKRALDRQLPSHDLDPEQCQSLSANEKRKMEEYVKNVKQFVVGQGSIQECPPRGKLPPPPPQLDRILVEKAGHLTLQSTDSAKQVKPISQLITARPFVKISSDAPTTHQIKQMSTKPHAGFQEQYSDLPPPPPDMLIGSPYPPPPDMLISSPYPPPPPPEPTVESIESENPIQLASGNQRKEDPVRDFFDFLDEQEGKKLPGKLKSPFLHQAAASGQFNAAARPFGVSPVASPNLSQRNPINVPSALSANAPVASRGSSPRLDSRRDGTVPSPMNGNQPTRRLLTTDFDYTPESSVAKSNNNNNNPSQSIMPICNNNNNNQSPIMDRHTSAQRPNQSIQQGTKPPPPPPQEKYVTGQIPSSSSIAAAANQANYQQEVIQESEQHWSCRKCCQPIQTGTVAIFAERAGSDKCWHPQCFVCSICHEMLADLIYFFVDDAMFCGRHYAEQMKIPRCKACDELIFAPEYTSAEGASWHMDHFCCFLCDTPLAGHQYTPIEGQPHCLDCYQKKYGKDCYECGRAIRAEESRVSHGEMNWHNTASCFKCRQCQTSMMNRQFVLKNGQIYCSRECVVQHAQCQAQPVLV